MKVRWRLVAAALWGACAAQDALAARRDVLWDILSRCVDIAVPGYCTQCRWPRADAACGEAAPCTQTTEVWRQDDRFVAIRDIKMCGCPEGFVHGLALPRQRVRGVEDPLRPTDIWRFAWDTAIERIEPQAIALAVNPAAQRSQDQLHVHLLRLRPQARGAFTNSVAGYVTDLGDVWRVAAEAATARSWADYGVLVAQAGSDGDNEKVNVPRYAVVVTAGSPEAAFTLWQCH